MSTVISRKQFLRGNFRGKQDIRPPWSLTEERFTELCSRCDDCIEICPEYILERGSAGFPRVNFQKGECTFCEKCVNVCKTGAIEKTDTGTLPWTLKTHIEQSCVAKKGVECRICGDSCDVEAIRFHYTPGAAAQPVIDDSACTGCGACVAPCPVNAVEIRN